MLKTQWYIKEYTRFYAKNMPVCQLLCLVLLSEYIYAAPNTDLQTAVSTDKCTGIRSKEFQLNPQICVSPLPSNAARLSLTDTACLKKRQVLQCPDISAEEMQPFLSVSEPAATHCDLQKAYLTLPCPLKCTKLSGDYSKQTVQRLCICDRSILCYFRCRSMCLFSNYCLTLWGLSLNGSVQCNKEGGIIGKPNQKATEML